MGSVSCMDHKVDCWNANISRPCSIMLNQPSANFVSSEIKPVAIDKNSLIEVDLSLHESLKSEELLEVQKSDEKNLKIQEMIDQERKIRLESLRLTVLDTMLIINKDLDYVNEHECNEGVYTGQLLNGLRSGIGILKLHSGSVYHGTWQNDLPTGKGKLLCPDSSTYEGDFLNGKFNGIGNYTKPDYIYFGDWKNNKKEGKGAEEFPYLGQKYEGEFKNNLRHGAGIWVCNGVMISGNFSLGKLVKGIVLNEGLLKIQMECEDGEMRKMRITDEGNFEVVLRNEMIINGKIQFCDGMKAMVLGVEECLIKLGYKKPR